MPEIARGARPPHDDRERRRADEGARPAARGAGQGAHRARRRRARGHRQAQGQEQDPRAHRAARPHATRCEFVSGVTTERIVELYAEAEVAVVPSLYEGFSLPAVEAMACGVPARRHHRRRAARGRRHRRRDRPARAARATPTRSAHRARSARSATPSCAARIGAAGRDRVLDKFTWRADRRSARSRTTARSSTSAPRPGAADADRRLRPPRPARRRPRCSTWAAAAGGTRSRRCGAARPSSRSTTPPRELKEVRATSSAR